MIDYNDGKWHGWQGRECPVHPKSVVSCVWHIPSTGHVGTWNGIIAGTPCWPTVIRFRVITPYVEPPKPREIWINEYPGGTRIVHDSPQDAAKARGSVWMSCKTTRWVEVLE
jgi:hypothetical protein